MRWLLALLDSLDVFACAPCCVAGIQGATFHTLTCCTTGTSFCSQGLVSAGGKPGNMNMMVVVMVAVVTIVIMVMAMSMRWYWLEQLAPCICKK